MGVPDSEEALRAGKVLPPGEVPSSGISILDESAPIFVCPSKVVWGFLYVSLV